MNTHRIPVTLCIILILGLLVTACSGGGTAPNPPPASTPSSGSSAPATTAPTMAATSALVAPTVAALATNAPSTSAPTAVASPPSGTTAKTLADVGQGTFASRCTGCHGQKGEGISGPAIIGSKANLHKYNSAKGLFDFISAAMPQDAPGSLSPTEYLQLTSFLMLQNQIIQPETPIDAGKLDTILLRK